jgi:hypothetical protein
MSEKRMAKKYLQSMYLTMVSYKEFLKFNHRKIIQFKMRHFSNKTQMTKKHMGRYPTSLAIRETQIKAT